MTHGHLSWHHRPPGSRAAPPPLERQPHRFPPCITSCPSMRSRTTSSRVYRSLSSCKRKNARRLTKMYPRMVAANTRKMGRVSKGRLGWGKARCSSSAPTCHCSGLPPSPTGFLPLPGTSRAGKRAFLNLLVAPQPHPQDVPGLQPLGCLPARHPPAGHNTYPPRETSSAPGPSPEGAPSASATFYGNTLQTIGPRPPDLIAL